MFLSERGLINRTLEQSVWFILTWLNGLNRYIRLASGSLKKCLNNVFLSGKFSRFTLDQIKNDRFQTEILLLVKAWIDKRRTNSVTKMMKTMGSGSIHQVVSLLPNRLSLEIYYDNYRLIKAVHLFYSESYYTNLMIAKKKMKIGPSNSDALMGWPYISLIICNNQKW